VPAWFAQKFSPIYKLLDNKYYLDWFNENVLARGARALGGGLWKGGDLALIDGALVNGSAKAVALASGLIRLIQTGYLYWYAFAMIAGLVTLMTVFLFLR
jgi:NADH-quinone oxidoreductase subunit L